MGVERRHTNALTGTECQQTLNTVLYFWSLGTMDNFAREKYRDLGVDQMKHLPEWMAESVHQRVKDAVPQLASHYQLLVHIS